MCAEQRIVECYKRMKSAHVFLKFSYAFALDNMILVPLIIIMWKKMTNSIMRVVCQEKVFVHFLVN